MLIIIKIIIIYIAILSVVVQAPEIDLYQLKPLQTVCPEGCELWSHDFIAAVAGWVCAPRVLKKGKNVKCGCMLSTNVTKYGFSKKISRRLT